MFIYVQFVKCGHFPHFVITEILVLYDLHCFIQLFLEVFIDIYVHGEFGAHMYMYIFSYLASSCLRFSFVCCLVGRKLDCSS
jgi:hypothetical protein